MNQYTPTIDSNTALTAARLLRSVGCSDAQVKEFSSRTFVALPLWLRKRLKKIGKAQELPAKLQPMEGERAAYLNPERFKKHTCQNPLTKQ